MPGPSSDRAERGPRVVEANGAGIGFPLKPNAIGFVIESGGSRFHFGGTDHIDLPLPASRVVSSSPAFSLKSRVSPFVQSGVPAILWRIRGKQA